MSDRMRGPWGGPLILRFLLLWLGWAIAFECLHILLAAQAAYEPGVPFAYLRTNFIEMYETPPLNYLGLLAFALLFALATNGRLERRRARKAQKSNHCPNCGYSLAGLATSSPCPECGATPGATD